MSFTADHALIAEFAENLPLGVWVARASDGAFAYANRRFREIMGVDARDDVTREGGYAQPYGIHTLSGELYPENQLPFARALAARADVIVDDMVIHRPDGAKAYIRAFARPLFDAKGEITYVVIIFTDITREVLAEKARAEGEARLRQAQRLEAVGQLAGGIAHDFNNLLATLRILAAQLRHAESDPGKLQLLQHIDDVTNSGVRLTKGLLGFARRTRNVPSRVSVNEVVQSIAELASRTFDRRLEINCELGAHTGIVMGDGAQLEQVVMNLVINARDATPGAGSITLSTRDMYMGPHETAARPMLPPGPYVVLEVRDTGTGIDPEIRDRIFEPYFTTKTTGPVRGSGLGLATVYGIVRQHGGYAESADNAPRGTVMRVFLPSAPPLDTAELPAAPPLPRARETQPGRGVVLLIEDERVVREATAGALRRLGYEVLEASNGLEAIDTLRLRRASLTAVILDLVLPKMAGREVFNAIHEVVPNVPVLLVTGAPPDDDARPLLEQGARAVLTKPYELDTLAATLQEITSQPGR